MDRVPCNNDLTGTGKSLSEALIFASNNLQYDDRLFIELRVQYMLCPKIVLSAKTKTKKQFDVHNMY